VNLATIDVGTNTTLLLVARVAPVVEALEERAEVTRLGRGIGHGGALGAEGIARTLAVLREYAAAARSHRARIAAVGTEALRRAPNASAFLDPAREILGAPVEVIDGEREAALTFRAVTASFPEATARGPLTVVDIGGGSTEVIVSDRGALRFRTSLPIGSVRLTERHIHHDPPAPDEVAAVEREVDAALAGVPFPKTGDSAAEASLVGVAGTVTSLAAMAQNLVSYDPARVHGFALERAALEAQVARLAASTQAERERMAGLDPRRADVILAGAIVLLRILRGAGASRVLVSDRGIRWGLLYEVISTDPAAEPTPGGP
jgi:exopolyphosphatase/guanosine-5'-triphosphate,3'-diphosphate pyrophosphatase